MRTIRSPIGVCPSSLVTAVPLRPSARVSACTHDDGCPRVRALCSATFSQLTVALTLFLLFPSLLPRDAPVPFFFYPCPNHATKHDDDGPDLSKGAEGITQNAGAKEDGVRPAVGGGVSQGR